MRLKRLSMLAAPILFFFATPVFAQPTTPQNITDEEFLARAMMTPDQVLYSEVLRRIVSRGKKDMVAALIVKARYGRGGEAELAKALTDLAGENFGADWHKWMEWQQQHPEIKPFHEFDVFKAGVLAGIDPNYRQLLWRGIDHEIRLEEVVWGGVKALTGIPSLDFPKHIAASEASFMTDEELVFGVAINGDVRAYPLRFMDWHEMFNDKVGGKYVTLAYCTLCASGILFDSTVEGRKKPFKFGSSGLLYRSNKLMYDHETKSLWNQFIGRPVVGKLTGSGIELKVLPVATVSWGAWKKQHPNTKVLSTDTGYERPYQPGAAYGEYFTSPNLMFPAVTDDKRLNQKDYVFALRAGSAEKAWPLKAFDGGKVINDKVGDMAVVLVGDSKSRTVRGYKSDGASFDFDTPRIDRLRTDAGEWRITEDALVGPDGQKLERLPGHIAFWFAWSGYKPKAAYYEGAK